MSTRHSIEHFKKEILHGYNQSKKIGKGYSTFGDRSQHIIKLYKTLKNSEDSNNFKEALKELIKNGDDEFLNFTVSVLTDGIDFGNVI
jgi:hypothetical protein